MNCWRKRSSLHLAKARASRPKAGYWRWALIALALGPSLSLHAQPGAEIRSAAQAEIVVLLHGLARTSASMDKLANALHQAGYVVCNLDYPSREHAILELARDHIAPAVEACRTGDERLHFVTHSLGGILVRQLAAANLVDSIGRVVMLAPPNQGSEVADRLENYRWFDAFFGPAGAELGTGATSVPRQLPEIAFELGVIAGNRSINPASFWVPGEDDGTVSVASTKLAGMRDFLLLPASHPFIMRDAQAIAQTLFFLRHGRFDHKDSAQAGELQSASK